MKSQEIQVLEAELEWIEEHKEDEFYSVDFVNGVKQALWLIQEIQRKDEYPPYKHSVIPPPNPPSHEG